MFRLGSGTFDSLLYPNSDSINFEGTTRGSIAIAKTYPWVTVEKVTFGVVLMGLYLFAARGIYLVVRGVYRGSIHTACLWLLLGTALYFLAVIGASGGVTADARVRLPVTLVVCILAAAGFRRKKTISQ